MHAMTVMYEGRARPCAQFVVRLTGRSNKCSREPPRVSYLPVQAERFRGGGNL